VEKSRWAKRRQQKEKKTGGGKEQKTKANNVENEKQQIRCS
jgi:hypothetical protein